MDSRKTIEVENLIVVLKSQGKDASKVESLLKEIRAERSNNPTTTNSEVIKNTYTA